MSRYYRVLLTLLSAVALLAMGAGQLLAQDTDTLSEGELIPEPEIIGDSEAESLQVVRQYLEQNDVEVLADDIIVYDRALLGPVTGRDNFINAQTGLYGAEFTNFLFRPARYIVADGVVIAELTLTGTHTAFDDAAEVPAGGQQLTPVDAENQPEEGEPMDDTQIVHDRAPALVLFEVDGGQIVRLDMYYDDAGTGAAYPAGYGPYGPTTAAGADPGVLVDLNPDNLLNDPDRFVGQRVVVQGNVGRAIHDRAFVLYSGGGLAELDEIVVVDATEDGLEFIQLADTEVLVSGVVERAVAADIEANYGLALDDGTLAEFEGGLVLLADNAVNLYDVATFGNIQQDPAAFYGQSVSISGDVGEHVDSQSMWLEERGLLNLTPERLLVIYPGAEEGTLPPPDTHVVVNGTVREFVRTDLEAEFGLTLDEGLYGQYEMTPVIVAENIYRWD